VSQPDAEPVLRAKQERTWMPYRYRGIPSLELRERDGSDSGEILLGTGPCWTTELDNSTVVDVNAMVVVEPPTVNPKVVAVDEALTAALRRIIARTPTDRTWHLSAISHDLEAVIVLQTPKQGRPGVVVPLAEPGPRSSGPGGAQPPPRGISLAGSEKDRAARARRVARARERQRPPPHRRLAVFWRVNPGRSLPARAQHSGFCSRGHCDQVDELEGRVIGRGQPLRGGHHQLPRRPSACHLKPPCGLTEEPGRAATGVRGAPPSLAPRSSDTRDRLPGLLRLPTGALLARMVPVERFDWQLASRTAPTSPPTPRQAAGKCATPALEAPFRIRRPSAGYPPALPA
jgi:hypothetical protein